MRHNHDARCRVAGGGQIGEYGTTGQVEEGRAFYKHLQAIKLAPDVAGGYGGPCRAPRGRLPQDIRAQVIKAVDEALAADLRGLL